MVAGSYTADVKLSVEIYSLALGQWRKTHDLPKPYMEGSLVQTSRGQILYIGGYNTETGQPSDEIFLYSFNHGWVSGGDNLKLAAPTRNVNTALLN